MKAIRDFIKSFGHSLMAIGVYETLVVIFDVDPSPYAGVFVFVIGIILLIVSMRIDS